MDKQELVNRIYDKLFDNIGTSKHHVPLEHNIYIIRQEVEGNSIVIELDSGEVFTVKVERE